MKQTKTALAALCAALAWSGVWAERTPAAHRDSDANSIDTRIGNADASANQMLDSRTGSQDCSNLRGLNTTKVGTGFIIR